MSQWRCKLEDQELGPMAFGELAELVRTGKVTERTRVARVGSMNWEPAWHVPGLFRAAGITEPGDSPAVEGSGFRVQRSDQQGALTPALSRREREAVLPGYVAPRVRGPLISLVALVRGLVAAAVGLLAVGFFYRWANQAALVFPMPPVEADGETVDCFFPLVGRCTVLECALLYVDVFAVAAVATWHAAARRLDSGWTGGGNSKCKLQKSNPGNRNGRSPVAEP